MSESVRLRPCPGSGAIIPPSPQTEQAGVCPRCKRLVARDGEGKAAYHFQPARRGGRR